MTASKNPEPWLRGRTEDLPAVLLAVLNAVELASENIDHWCFLLSKQEFHAQPLGLPSVAFHVRHIARSIDRLLAYAEGNSLSEAQLAALKTESEATATVHEVLAEFHRTSDFAVNRVRNFARVSLELPRAVGRQQLPSTVGGILVHIADHTQRHTGQIVTTAKVLLAQRQCSH